MSTVKQTHNKSLKICSILFIVFSLALFLFLYAISCYNVNLKTFEFFTSKKDVIFAIAYFAQALFSIFIPLFMVKIFINYAEEHPNAFISFLAINLMIHCGSFYLILIENKNSFIIPSFNITLIIAVLFYFIFYKDFKNNLSHSEKEKVDRIETLNKTLSNIMIGQMKQHFLYNTLNTIKFLISEDPEKAEFAVIKLSEYIRVNMESLTNDNFILFEKELYHIRNYIDIEHLRFGNKVSVEYNIETTDFYIPALVVQPLVENAVKHGITKKVNGGNIKVNVFSKNSNYIIEVIDDGVGFDTSTITKKETSLAIKNIKKRLSIIKGASFSIASKIGEGTTVVISIPKILPSYLKTLVKKERKEKKNEKNS